MDILNLPYDQFKIFLLVLTRVSVILFLFPVFDTPVFPTRAKVGLACFIAILLTPVVNINPAIFPDNLISFGLIVVCEIIIGLAMGICIRIFIGAVQLGGQIVGFQMGFSMINVVDPQSGANISILSQLGYFTVLLVFVLMNGHHIIIEAVAQSFNLIQVGKINLDHALLSQLRTLISGMFVLGIKISSPALAALIFTDSAFGICAKFVPQMHILVVAFPVKIAIGLIMMGSCLEIIYLSTINYIGTFKALLIAIMRLF